jgi:hypothetical protein
MFSQTAEKIGALFPPQSGALSLALSFKAGLAEHANQAVASATGERRSSAVPVQASLTRRGLGSDVRFPALKDRATVRWPLRGSDHTATQSKETCA